MSDKKPNLKAKKQAVEDQFNQLEAQRQQLVEQRKEMDRRMSQIAEALVTLRGKFAMLEELEQEEGGNGKPEKKIPSKKAN